MTKKRYNELMEKDGCLTEEELEEGWHWYCEWDYLLIHPSWEEAQCCSCVGD